MNITKLGHSCLLIEENNTRILIDPGSWSQGHTELENLSAIFITHEHNDHCDIPSLKAILTKNPTVPIYTNDHVGKKLAAEGVSYELFEEGRQEMIAGIKVEAFGKDHAVIYQTSPCHNTGYLFNGKLFHPGDSLTIPAHPVATLALPVCAPWLKMQECVDFALAIRPKKAFAIHDAMLKEQFAGFHKYPSLHLPEASIEFFVPQVGKVFKS